MLKLVVIDKQLQKLIVCDCMTSERLCSDLNQTKQKEPKRGNPEKKIELVMILEQFTPRSMWSMGKVVETYRSFGGIARSCVKKNWML